MAVITVSSTGGNFNATSSWVGGVVPTSTDDIVGAVTSGQLTVNVASSVRSMNFAAYNNTITFNANLSCITATTNNVGGASCSYAGSGSALAGTNALVFVNPTTITQNNTNRIPHFRKTGSTATTLSTDIYCRDLSISQSATPLNGSTIYCSGNFIESTSNTTLTIPSISGSTNLTLDGNGLIRCGYHGTGEVKINTTGTYSTFGQGLLLGYAAGIINTVGTFSWISGNTGGFNLFVTKGVNGNDSYGVNNITSTPINLFVRSASSIPPGSGLLTLNTTGLSCSQINTVVSDTRLFTTDVEPPIILIQGGTFSTGVFNTYPFMRFTSATTDPPASNATTFKAPSFRLDPNYTHTIGRFELSGGGIPSNPIIRSSVTGSQVSINLVSKTASQIIDYNFIDVNAVGQQIVAINGTFSNTTNVTNVYPTGATAGVSGGSFTFVN